MFFSAENNLNQRFIKTCGGGIPYFEGSIEYRGCQGTRKK